MEKEPILGEYEATIDSKGRFLLPVGFKKQLGDDESAKFVVNRGFEGCLCLYTLQNWELVSRKVVALNDFDPRKRAFKRMFLNGATYVSPDTAGRLLLPANLKAHAGLEKDIVLLSTVNKIEIWDSVKYKQLFDAISMEDLSDLGNELLGGSADDLIIDDL